MKNSASKKPIKSSQKADHLAPTKITTPKPIKGPEKSQNLTHGEVKSRLEVYGRVGHLMNRHNVVQDIKERYQSQITKVEAVRTKADINYSMGVRSGLPHASHETIRNAREMADQKFRNGITKEMGQRYKQGENLTKQFKQQQPTSKKLKSEFQKNKNKGMGRER
ncbi:hypothetical protein [Reichenbachiella sp.]|uniref:hypothetical protein n=1 Tax=Reichenbachiella sp. TaxID=2184521 RepID=UPI00329A305A